MPHDEDASDELEVNFKPETGKAVIEGKTTVPFQSFVTLILQRKVQTLFKDHSKASVIVGSDLLTRLASAPQDSQENKSRLIFVSLGLGVIAGVAVLSIVQVLLMLSNIPMGYKEHAVLLGCIAGLAILSSILLYMQKLPKSEKLTETIEGIAQFLGK